MVASVTLHDKRIVKLGRRRPAARPQALRFAAYFDPRRAKAPPPSSVDWAAKAMAALLRVYLNDQYGDCVIARSYHQYGIWTGNESGTPAQATDAEVLATYHQICGAGDNGCVITDVLDVMRDHGLKVNGVTRKIDGYVSVDWTNKLEVQTAIDLFGSLAIGINLPDAWTCTNCTWSKTTSAIVGGHDVGAVGYNAQGVQICTWGGIVTISWDAFLSRDHLEECYALLAPDWYAKGNLAPNGINVQSLKDDLAKLGGGTIPPLPDPIPPGPTPTPPIPTPPTPPSPAPVPSVFTINVPTQPVFSTLGNVHIGNVPAFKLQGRLGEVQPAAILPPWLLNLARALCAAGVIPPPYNAICAFLPPAAESPCGCH